MRLALVFVVAFVAGCAGPAPAALVESPDAQGAAALAKDVSLNGCREVGMGRFVSFEQARALVPEGFEPADAGAFLGFPAPAGRSAVITGHLDCAASILDGGAVAWSDLLVPIERPRVEGLALDETMLDAYQLAQFTSGGDTAALFASVGFTVLLSDVSADAGSAVSSVARASTSVDGEDILSFEAAGAAETTYILHARFWHETPTGLAYVEHTRTPTPLRLGGLVSCDAAAGSLFADAFGTTACAGPDSFAGVFPEPSDFASTFHYLPGARVASGG